jgi:hypothetical protein
MPQFHDIQRLGRIALTALCIGAGAVALSALPLDNAAQAKNGDHGGGQGGDHGGGHGDHGGNGGGNGNGNGHGANHGPGPQHGSDDNSAASGNAGANTGTSPDTSDDGASLSAHGLGKLNGFFHASPQALANASPNSSIGRVSQTFEAALSAYAEAQADQQQQQPGQDGSTPPTPPTATSPTVDDLGAILAGATNKPVTATQVQAIAARLAALHPADTALAHFAANADEATCQEIADAANAAKGNAGDTTTDDTTTTSGTTTAIVTTTSTSE